MGFFFSSKAAFNVSPHGNTMLDASPQASETHTLPGTMPKARISQQQGYDTCLDSAHFYSRQLFALPVLKNSSTQDENTQFNGASADLSKLRMTKKSKRFRP